MPVVTSNATAQPKAVAEEPRGPIGPSQKGQKASRGKGPYTHEACTSVCADEDGGILPLVGNGAISRGRSATLHLICGVEPTIEPVAYRRVASEAERA